MSTDRLIAGPVVFYIGTTGAAKPVVNAPPPDPYVELAIKQYGDEVNLRLPQTLNAERLQGDTYPVKHFRMEEDAMVRAQLKNMDLNVLRRVLNDNPVAVTPAGPGQVGIHTISLERGLTVRSHSLVMRFVSPWNPEWNMQIWLPQVVVENELDLPFRKAEATMYEIIWKAEKHTSLGVGELDTQFAAATA